MEFTIKRGVPGWYGHEKKPVISRLVLPGLQAGIITMLLLYMMNLLIDSEEVTVTQVPAAPIVKFVRLQDTEEPLPSRTRERPPEPQVEPEKPEVRFTQPGNSEYGTDLSPPKPDTQVTVGLGEGGAMPLVAVSADYPIRALERGVEGYVVVTFDITSTGQVVNASVVERQPSGIFDRSALQAIAKFRYKPKVVDGQPVPVSGLYYRFTFEMEKV